jgi:hypothetical protein
LLLATTERLAFADGFGMINVRIDTGIDGGFEMTEGKAFP